MSGRKDKIIDLLIEGSGQYMVRAERLEDCLSALVRQCEGSRITEGVVPCRSDLQRIRDALDEAKRLLP